MSTARQTSKTSGSDGRRLARAQQATGDARGGGSLEKYGNKSRGALSLGYVVAAAFAANIDGSKKK